MTLTRRDALKLASAAALAGAPLAAKAVPSAHKSVEQWECFEMTLQGPSMGNPFLEVELGAVFSQGHRTVSVDGFYDGDGVYKVRFMPDALGEWRFRTASATKALDGHEGAFVCTAATGANHGPVRVERGHHFGYADGTPYSPFGTTAYAWIHQSDELQQQTLEALRTAPFNKIRMCVFPKSYEYNHNEPPFYPFPRPGGATGTSDLTRFVPAFFQHLEQRIADLRALGVEADLMLFHPYDRWEYSAMPAEVDARYLRYLIARLAAYRNVWWSLANEFDLMKHKTTADFDRFAAIVQERDPYAHLRSIHYSKVMYDYARPWVTHASLQRYDFEKTPEFFAAWNKPVVFDEIEYEGNLARRWGNITGDEMVHRFWMATVYGAYATHGEVLLDPDAEMTENAQATLVWSHGGPLKGTSPTGIAFLRGISEGAAGKQARAGWEPAKEPYYLNATTFATDGKTAQAVLWYLAQHQPLWYEFPLPAGSFTAELIDTRARTRVPIAGTHAGKSKIRLPAKPYMAVLFRRV